MQLLYNVAIIVQHCSVLLSLETRGLRRDAAASVVSERRGDAQAVLGRLLCL